VVGDLRTWNTRQRGRQIVVQPWRPRLCAWNVKKTWRKRFEHNKRDFPLDNGRSSRLSTAFAHSSLWPHCTTWYSPMDCSNTSNKRSYEHKTLGMPHYRLHSVDEGCPALNRFQKKFPNEPWRQVALQLLPKMKEHMERWNIPRKDEQSQKKALRTDKLHKDILFVKWKLTDLEEMVYSSADEKEFQQAARLMEHVEDGVKLMRSRKWRVNESSMGTS
jgi:hypothetical protein